MKVIGYRKADFVAKDNTEIKGYNVYLTSDINPRYGAGQMAERIYLSAARLARENLSIDELVGHELKITYTRYGKVDSILLAD